MRHGIWLYPWDLADRGPESVARELDELGIDEAYLALSYHSVRVLLPDNPKRRIFDAPHGAVYFRPDARAWSDSEIRPDVSDCMSSGGDIAEAARDAFAQRSLSLVAWTVCLHQSALVDRHPGAAMVDVWGGRSRRAFCLNQPATRSFARSLVRDVASRTDAVQLEAAHWLAPHAMHSKLDAPQPHLLKRLSAFCVCDRCADAIAKSGGDPDRCRAQLGRVADRCMDEAEHVVPAGEADAHLADLVADYAALCASRGQAVTSLVAELVRECAGRPVEFVSYGDRRATGADLAAIERAGAAVRVLAYGPAPIVADVVAEVRSAQDAPQRFALGLSALVSDVADESALRVAHDVALSSGATSVGFYNYGMLPAARRRWLGDLRRT